MIYEKEEKYMLFMKGVDHASNKLGYSDKQIANDLGIFPQYLYSIKKRQRPVSDDLLNKILKSYDLVENKSNDLNKPKGLAVYEAYASAGIGAINEATVPVEYINVKHFSDCEMGIYVRGDSMHPIYNNGDLIALKPITDFELIQWGKPYAILTQPDSELFVKYVRKHPTNEKKVILRSANEYYEDMEVSLSKIKKLWRIKGVIKLE